MMVTKPQSVVSDWDRIHRHEQLGQPSRSRNSDQPWPLPSVGAQHLIEQEVASRRHSFFAGQTLQKFLLPSKGSSSDPPRAPKRRLSDPRLREPEAPPSVPPIPPRYRQSVDLQQPKPRNNGTQRPKPTLLPSRQPYPDTHGFPSIHRENSGLTLTAQKKAYRVSQLLDTQSGHVHRRQLSECLRDILDPSFELPQLPAHAIDVDIKFELGRSLVSHAGLHSDHHNVHLRENVPKLQRNNQQLDQNGCPQVYFVSRCQCPPGAVICYCQSSEEFKHFHRWHRERKVNSSISSNVCMLAVPRARFRGVVPTQEDKWCSRSIDSRPGWSFETKATRKFTTDFGEWPLPPSTKSSKSSNSWTTTAESTSTKQCSKDARVSSFSRPFRPESGGSPRLYFGSPRSSSDSSVPNSPLTPSSSVGLPSNLPQSDPKIARLDSVSTLSTFHFDFDEADMRQSLMPPKLVINKPSVGELAQSWQRPISTPFSIASCDTDTKNAVGDRPDTGYASEMSDYGSFSTFQLATATAKPIVVMTRPLPNTSSDDVSTRNDYQSLATSRRKVASPVFERPKLVDLRG